MGGVAGSGGGAGGLPGVASGSIRSLLLYTNDLVFDPKRGVLYATTSVAPGGGAVVTIDPGSATFTNTLAVGGIAGVLAISDDASALYVGISTPNAPSTPTPGIDGGDTVRRIDLASMTVGAAVSLGSNSLTKLTAGEIAAVPGSSTQYIVARRQPQIAPEFGGLALYDGTTLLTQLDAFYGSGDSIAFSDPATLFGCSNDLSPSQVTRYGVTSAAITAGMKLNDLIAGGEATRITADAGWVFAGDGQTFNATTMAWVGTFDDGNGNDRMYSRAAPVPDPDGANVWFLRTARSPAVLDFNRSNFQLSRFISLAVIADDADLSNASAFVQWAPRSFAFRTHSTVYLMTVPN